MGIITFKHKGDFSKTEKFFNRMLRRNYMNILAEYGKRGCELLQQSTPVDTGRTADSWDFGIEEHKGRITLYWTNSNMNEGVCVAILLLYGHGLQNGGYVTGTDYISPVIEPMMHDLANECWKEVTR